MTPIFESTKIIYFSLLLLACLSSKLSFLEWLYQLVSERVLGLY